MMINHYPPILKGRCMKLIYLIWLPVLINVVIILQKKQINISNYFNKNLFLINLVNSSLIFTIVFFYLFQNQYMFLFILLIVLVVITLVVSINKHSLIPTIVLFVYLYFYILFFMVVHRQIFKKHLRLIYVIQKS